MLGTQRPAIEYPTVTSGDDHATLLSTVQKLQAVINTLRAHGLITT